MLLLVKRTFKDFLNQDITNVFVNRNEFAENVVIDGKEFSVVIDNDILVEKNLKNGGEGLITDKLLFHVKNDDMPFVPSPGQGMLFNDTYYFIADVTESLGMYSITLEVRDS